MLAGGITVPIYPSSLKETVAYILKDSEASFIFVEDKKQLDKLLAIKAEIPQVKAGDLVGRARGKNDPKVDEWVVPLRELCDRGRAHRLTQPQALPELRKQMTGETVATIIYTSGTTGNPKRVVQSHASFVVGSRYGVNALPVKRSDRQLLFLPLAHPCSPKRCRWLPSTSALHGVFGHRQHLGIRRPGQNRPLWPVPRI